MDLQIKQISEDDFYGKYKPVQNHLDKDAGWEGQLYETFGEELDYCYKLAIKEKRVWTIVECDDIEYDPDFNEDDELDEDDEPKACMYIISGFHLVNRIGFMITENPYEEATEVKLDL